MITLASGSWLRKTILEASEFDFRVHTKEIDERALEVLHPEKSDADIAIILASAKAHAVLEDRPDDLIIAADTFVILPSGERLHKPADTKEAIKLCLMQSDTTIQAITGIAMIYRGKVLTSTSTTLITYIDFDQPTIERLLTGSDVTVRNAGLGFFSDSPGFTLVKSLEGSFTGAMGLPMEIVRENMALLNYDHLK